MGGRSNKSNVVQLDPEEIDRIETEVGEIMAAVPARIWDGRSLPVPIDLPGFALSAPTVRLFNAAYWRKVPTEDGDYTMDHTASILLLDSEGRFRKTIAWGENSETALQKLRDLAKT